MMIRLFSKNKVCSTNSQISKFSAYPLVQWHWKSFTRSAQTAPFWHGFDSQSLMFFSQFTPVDGGFEIRVEKIDSFNRVWRQSWNEFSNFEIQSWPKLTFVSTVFTVAFVAVHLVDTLSVLAWIVLAVVDVQLTVRSVEAGIADALVATERVDALAVLARTVLALVDVLLAELALEAGRTGADEAGHPINAGAIVLTLRVAKT